MKKFLLFLVAALSAGSMAFAQDCFLVGKFNSWTPGDANYKFTKEGTNYTITVAELAGEFKICGQTWDDPNFSSKGAVVIGDNKFVKTDQNSTANNLKNATLSFTWDGKADNFTVNIKADEEVAGETVTIKGDYNIAYSGDKLKVYYWGGTEAPEWSGVEMTEVTGSDGKTYKVCKVAEGTTKCIFNTNGDADKTGDLDYTGEFIMNDYGATKTPVKFEAGDEPGPGPDPDPDPQELPDMFLVGKFNEWTPGDANYKFTEADGVYTLEVAALDGEFKIMGKDWENYPNFGGEGEFGATEAKPVDAVIGENSCWKGSACNLVADNFTDVTLSFAWDGKAENIKLTITKGTSGINDIEVENAEAVYYNLQGVRVAEPTTGIYIKVAGNKATKVAF